MRWVPTKATQGVDAYDTFTFAWAGTGERRYMTRPGGVGRGTVSSTAPANVNELIKFDIPRGADMFGIEFLTQRASGSDDVTALTTHKIEAYVDSVAGDVNDFTMRLDSGDNGEPYLWFVPGSAAPAVTTSMIISRRFIDISGGDANWGSAGGGPIRSGTGVGLSGDPKRSIIWISHFGANAGLPYVGPYNHVYFTYSIDPGTPATITSSWTVKIRPVALRLASDLEGVN